MYIQSPNQYKFLFEDTFRRPFLVELREQPMDKNNANILKTMSNRVGIDIISISLYNLISRVNNSQALDDYCWNIVQKLIFWG